MINKNSELAQRFWEEGKLSDCPILDFHAHMGDAPGLYLPKMKAELMLDTMNNCNTLLTIFSGHDSLFMPSLRIEKDISVVKENPDRFKAYYTVLSNYLDPENDLKKLEENPDVFVGFKFHGDFYSVPLADSGHEPYWEYANKNQLLILSHTWDSQYSNPDEVEKILSKYPDLIFIAGHSFHANWDRAIELAKKHSNLYLELTAVLDDRGPLDLFVKELGSERILFGTDLPWFSTHHGIGAVLSAKMTDDDRKNIFYRNGAKLLKRFQWFESVWKAKNI